MYPAYTTDTEDIEYDGTIRLGAEKSLGHDESEGSISFSEKSYLPLFTSEEILNITVSLNYSLTWHYYTLLATNAMYFVISYEVAFDRSIQNELFVILAKTLCTFVLTLDSLITLFHYFSKTAKYKIAYGNIDVGLLITQVLSLLIVPLQLLNYLIYDDSLVVSSMLLAMYALKYYKLLTYVLLMYKIPCEITLINLYRKNFIVFSMVIHSFACIWMGLGCLEGPEICEKKFAGPGSYWNAGKHYEMFEMSRNQTVIDDLTPFGNYIICLFYVMGGFTHVGFGGSSPRNYLEDLICIITMFIYIFLVYSLHSAELCNCNIYKNMPEFNILRRRQAMLEDLRSSKFIQRPQRRRMLTYYKEFWEKDKAVKTSFMLQVIPTSLFVDTQTEIFWIFLNKCYFLRHTTASFRRAVASKIKIEVLNVKDVLYELNEISENVYYIARGNVQVLSSEDGHSTVVTLGKGTCLGQIHLVHKTITKFKVLIASYSVVYILNKRDFWIEAYKFRKLHQSAKVHENYESQLYKVLDAKSHKKTLDIGTIFRKWKCIVAKKILTNFKEDITRSQQKWVKLGTSEYEDPNRLYTYSALHTQKTYDEIFIKTSFPWILQQNSQFLNLWNYVVVIVVVYVAILYPYQAAFKADIQDMPIHVVSTVYILDILIQIFTAIDSKLDIVTKVEHILLTRLEGVKFTLDIIATIPMYLIMVYFDMSGYEKRIVHLSCLNKLLKLYKVDEMLNRIEINTEVNVKIFRPVKNILYLVYLGYLLGCLYYIVTCFHAIECDEGSWVEALNRVLAEDQPPGYKDNTPIVKDNAVLFSLVNMLLVFTGTSTAFTVNLTEIGVMIVVALLGIMLTINLIVGYMVSVTLSNKAAVEFMEFLNTTKDYMSFAKMNEDLKIRVVKSLENIWMVNKGTVIRDLYADFPGELYNKNQILRYRAYLRQMDLFKHTTLELQNAVAARCTELYLPPHEYIIYAGQACFNWYVIMNGYCGIIEGLAIQKMLDPGSTVNTMELFSGLPSLITIRTETHCKLLKFSLDDLKYLLKAYPPFKKEIINSIDQMAVSRIFTRIGEIRNTPKVDRVEDRVKSFFVFPTQRRHPLNLDYRKGFYRGKWKFLKFFMMKWTILPNGRFYQNWELFRAICAVIVSFLAPCSFIHYAYIPRLKYFLYVLYCCSFIDIYLKMHLCYHNKRGILVSHPKFTAVNYMSHSFALDAFSIAPLSWLVLFLANTENCKVGIILNFNMVIQMYRYPNAFANAKSCIYNRDGIIITILKYIPFTLVILNMLTCILLCISGKEVEVNGVTTLMKDNMTWMSSVDRIRQMDLNTPWGFYMVGFYFTTLTVMGVGFNLLRASNVNEGVYVIFCLLIGYLLKITGVVYVAHNRFNRAYKLTQHRNYMVHLSKYMKDEKLPKDLQRRILKHYEHVWRMTHAVTPRHIFSMMHIPLKMDIVHFLYRNTLRKVPVFDDANEAFYRHFGLCLNEVYMRKDATLIRLNDIVDKVYIIHRGEATVVGPDGSIFATLQAGSMFGNLDNVEATRSMVSIYAITVVDLLVMDTMEMYKIFRSFEYIFNKLQHYLLLENLFYIPGRLSSGTAEDDFEVYSYPNVSKFRLILMRLKSSTYMIMFDVFTYFLCCWLVAYQAAFLTPFDFFYVLYVLDVLHVINVIFLILIPDHKKESHLTIEKQDVIKLNWKSWRFFIDIIAMPPYDLIGFAFENSTEIRYYIALYRLIRVVNIYHSFERSKTTFGVKVIVFRLIKMKIYIMLIVHLCACFWYQRACPSQKCYLHTWMYSNKGQNCEMPYICSIYLVMSVISTTGFQNRIPMSGIVEMLICCCLVILGQYMQGSIVGDTIALVRNSTMDLADYNFESFNFQIYLKNGFASLPLMENLRKYCIYLWTMNHGRQIPSYLRVMPKYLLEELKGFAYGKHIYENCHKDFLRLLISQLRVEYFFVDDVICNQEDINDKMYFIHKGVVNVYSLTPREEVHIDELRELDSFGIVQGLFPNTPHTHTYKANTVCVILYLRYQDLAPLLTFYPASKFEIYSNMMLLFPEKQTLQKRPHMSFKQSKEVFNISDEFIDLKTDAEFLDDDYFALGK